jgi:hypothetical protein
MMQANHMLQRAAAGRRGCKRRASWPPSLSSGREAHLARFMKHLFIMSGVLSLMAIAILAGGCNQIKDSGIPRALNTDALLRTAGTAQGITFGAVGSGHGRSGYAVQGHRDFAVTISSGTAGQLLAVFRSEVKREIESMGGKIHDTGVSGGGTDVRAFSYGYSWSGNEGIVRVHSFVGTNGQVEITLFCYEHRR